MRGRQLNEAVSVSFSGSAGNAGGTGFLGPGRYGIIWHVTRILTNASTPTTQQLTLQVYRGAATPSAFLTGTYSGQQDADDIRLDLSYGDQLACVYSGGNPGDVGTVTLIGTFEDIRGV